MVGTGPASFTVREWCTAGVCQFAKLEKEKRNLLTAKRGKHLWMWIFGWCKWSRALIWCKLSYMGDVFFSGCTCWAVCKVQYLYAIQRLSAWMLENCFPYLPLSVRCWPRFDRVFSPRPYEPFSSKGYNRLLLYLMKGRGRWFSHGQQIPWKD